MARRRHLRQQHANHDRWLVSYADFITLLFAFFVVMYAASRIDRDKMMIVAASIEDAFAGQHTPVAQTVTNAAPKSAQPARNFVRWFRPQWNSARVRECDRAIWSLCDVILRKR